MANEFYKGYKKDQVQKQYQAAAAPDITQGLKDIESRSMAEQGTINALTTLGQSILKVTDARLQDNARVRGMEEAQADLQDPNGKRESSAGGIFSWTGETQRNAYNNLRVQTELVDFPEAIEGYMTNDKDLGGKSLDELTNNERASAYQRAKTKYFQERKITGSGYQKEANEYATKLEMAHLPQLHKQAVQLRESKATAMIGEQVTRVARKLQSPEEINNFIKNMGEDYASALTLGETEERSEAVRGSLGNLANKTKTDSAIIQGFMETILKDPESNVAAIDYMKSKEAKETFGYLKDFDDVVTRVDKLTLAAQKQVRAEREDTAINNYYRELRTGAFKSPEQLKSYLDQQQYMSEKQKFDLGNSGMKHVTDSNTAYSLKSAYDRGETGLINSQSKDVRKALFAQEVGDADKFRFNEGKVDLKAMRALVSHSNAGFDVDESISEFFDTKTMNTNTLTNQLENLVVLKDMGLNNITSVIPATSIPRLELFAKMKAEGTDVKEMKTTLQKYDDFAAGIGGADVWSNVDNMWRDNKFGDEISSWVVEGGDSGIFSSEMQPWLTTSDMSTDSSRPSNQYAQGEIKRSFARYIYSGDTPENALQRAKDDFKNNNQWENFGNTQVYIPKFIRKDAESIMDYVDNEDQVTINGSTPNILSEVMLSKGLDFNNKDLRDLIKQNNVSVQPASDFGITRRLEVYYDGKPTGHTISKPQLDSFGEPARKAKAASSTRKLSKEIELKEMKRKKEEEAFLKLTNKIQELFK